MDLAYCMIKYVTAEEEDHWPGWTGFNTLLRKDNIPDVSRVGYLPIVDASPTEYSTLNEVLNSGIRITEKLRLQQTVVVFDEAVYAKVQHIGWKEQSFYDKFVVRLGEFHASMSYLSAISKLFEDGGLKVFYEHWHLNCCVRDALSLTYLRLTRQNLEFALRQYHKVE